MIPIGTLLKSSVMYSFLADLGLRTTKAVWPIQGSGDPKIGGATCDDPEYLKLILHLKEQGFEIALHNVTHHTSLREQTAKGIERFKELFGHYPYSMANHSGCAESIYWESARVSGAERFIYNMLNLRLSNGSGSQGHVQSSPLFWGDCARRRSSTSETLCWVTSTHLKHVRRCPIAIPTGLT